MLLSQEKTEFYNSNVSNKIPSSYSSTTTHLSDEALQKKKKVIIIEQYDEEPFSSTKNDSDLILGKYFQNNSDVERIWENISKRPVICNQSTVSFNLQQTTCCNNDLEFSVDELPTPVGYVKLPWNIHQNWSRLLASPDRYDAFNLTCPKNHPAAEFLKRVIVDRVMKNKSLKLKKRIWQYNLRAIVPNNNKSLTHDVSPVTLEEVNTAHARFPAAAICEIKNDNKKLRVWSLKHTRNIMIEEKILYFKTKLEELPVKENFFKKWETRFSRIIEKNISLQNLTVIYDFRFNHNSSYHTVWELSCMKYLIHLAAMTARAIKICMPLIALQIVLLTPPSFDTVMQEAEEFVRLSSRSMALPLSEQMCQFLELVKSSEFCCGYTKAQWKSELTMSEDEEEVEKVEDFIPLNSFDILKKKVVFKNIMTKNNSFPGQVMHVDQCNIEEYIPAPYKPSGSVKSITEK